jgi:ATP-binding cassette subfamily B protein/ATP-binding cassette subfamily C protein
MQRGKIVAVVIFSFIINLLMLTVPLYLLQIFNRVIPSQSVDTLIFLTIIVFASLVTLAVLEALRRLVFSNIGSWLDKRLGGFILSGSIVRSVNKCRPSSAQTLRDLSTIRGLFSGSSLFPILDIPWTPIFMLVLFLLHPVIGMITLAGAIVLFLVALFNEFSTRNLTALTDEATTASNRYATSVLRNSDVIQAMGMRSNVISTWDNYHDKSVELQSELSARSNRIASFAKFIRMILQIVVIGAGGLLVLYHELTAGGLIASVLLMRRAVAPMDRAINSWKVIINARNAFKSVNRRLNLSPELRSETTLPLPSGYLSARNVSYTYPNRSKATLQDVTFRIRPGEAIGITGNTAAGKSTLARLLVGLAEPDSGYIRFDGMDIARWKAEDIGPYIGYLPQDNELFAGTVEANIARMGIADKTTVAETAKLAGVHEMILQFPQGYETEIGEEGIYLSGGQRQRIALARAIFGSPKLLVLDEPDANLDSEGKAALSQVIHVMKQQGTMIIFISHQEKVLEFADKVLRMNKGKIENVFHSSDDNVVNNNNLIQARMSRSLK